MCCTPLRARRKTSELLYMAAESDPNRQRRCRFPQALQPARATPVEAHHINAVVFIEADNRTDVSLAVRAGRVGIHSGEQIPSGPISLSGSAGGSQLAGDKRRVDGGPSSRMQLKKETPM